MTRAADKDHLEWNTGEFLEHLKRQVQVSEIHVPIFGAGNTERRHQPSKQFPEKWNEGTAKDMHAFPSRQIQKTACLLPTRKYGHCFICIRKGHEAVECIWRLFCKVCNNRLHVALCERNKDLQSSKSLHPANPTAPPIVGSILGKANITSCTKGLGSASSVALQTTQAVMNGSNENIVRVLFDSGNQKTFAKREVMEEAEQRIVRNANGDVQK